MQRSRALLILAFCGFATAAPVFTWSFTQPSGSLFYQSESPLVTITLVNPTDQIQRLQVDSINADISEFLVHYELRTILAFALYLAPYEVRQIDFGRFVWNLQAIPDGTTLRIGYMEFLSFDPMEGPAGRLHYTVVPSSNGFERTLFAGSGVPAPAVHSPEPATGSMILGALGAFGVAAVCRRIRKR